MVQTFTSIVFYPLRTSYLYLPFSYLSIAEVAGQFGGKRIDFFFFFCFLSVLLSDAFVAW